MQENNKSMAISITTSTMIRAVLVLLGFFLLYYLRDLVLVILTSIVIASFLESASSRFKKIGIGRVFGVVLIYVFGLTFLAGVFYLFAPLLITEIYNFSTLLANYLPDSNIINFFQNSAFSGAKDLVANLQNNISISTLLETSKAFVSNLSGGFFSTLSSAFGSIFNLILIVIISFYLSIQEKGIESFLRIVVPQRHEDYAVDLWERVRRKIALWVKGQMMLGLIIGILVYLVLSIIGIQYALLLAVITGMFELIPYGLVVSMVPAIGLGFLSSGFSGALMVGGAYFIIHQFEAYLLAPLIVKRVTGLSPLIVILAILIGYDLAGLWGVILAIPAAVFTMELLNDIEKKKIFTKEQKELKENEESK
ncbi:MAG: AI-2E family transporter [Candidatus Nomurabacteria bacterium]|nr:AI-2E family transporter [Candidatus Nomurabacteria bacterium]